MAAVLFLSAVSAPSADADFGFKSLAAGFTDEDGSPVTKAGSHPYAWTGSLTLNTTGSGSEEQPEGFVKDMRIQLPAGLVGTPAALPHCSHAEYLGKGCPAASELGVISFRTGPGETESFSLYNLEPLPGSAAELGFTVQRAQVIMELRVATTPPYNLTASIGNASQAAVFFDATFTIKGVSGGAPFLTLPRSCTPTTTTAEADPWQAPGAWVSYIAPETLTPTGCGSLGFEPTLSAQPTIGAARAPSGFDLDLDLPNQGFTSPTGTASADLSAATLDLPAGMTINPALAAGLDACSPAQLAAETPTSVPGAGCPQSARIGTAEVITPLLEKPVQGTIFVATPDDPATSAPGAENPLDARYALYLILREPERGVLVSVPIRLEADPVDGRLTAIAADLPQLPLTHIELHFSSGPRAPLVTPPCGTAGIDYSLRPSSGAAPSSGTQPVTTSSNCRTPAFHPSLSAGSASNAAGSSAPFLLDLASDPGEPDPAAFHLTLPPGLSADLASVPTCPESAIPGCPPSSRLGSARIALGAGPEPLWIPEAGRQVSDVYLAGPYRGAPYSLVVVVPAQAGPFDLGRVVLRAPIRIDPRTAQVSLSIEALPQILAGVPIQYRHIRLRLDRAGFIHNPTSCEPTQLRATATSVDGTRVDLASRFQTADCAVLPFKPRLALHLSGGLGRNGHPSLRAVLNPRSGEAGIAAVGFTLPAGELLDFHHLRALCARELPAERCPSNSRLGHARLSSPFLQSSLEGPIYLREPSHRLPDLLADLHSGAVHILLEGNTAAPRGRLRVHFGALPDVPISRAVITLAGGRRGIFANSESLCGHHRRGRATLSAHSGKSRLLRPRLRLHGRC